MATMTSATFFLLLLSLGTSTYGLLGIPIGTATPSLPVPTPNPTVPTPTLPVPTPNPTVPTLPTTPSVPYLPNPSVPALPNPIGNPALGVTCPINALKLGVCANVLGGLLNVVLGGGVAKAPCCSLVAGLLDLDAAVCLCTAIKANVLGINLNVPLSLSLLLNDCGKNLPAGFLCL